jgi:hypothetical protein
MTTDPALDRAAKARAFRIFIMNIAFIIPNPWDTGMLSPSAQL